MNNSGVVVKTKSGENITLKCICDGYPLPNIVWKKNGQSLISSSKRNISSTIQDSGFRSPLISGVLQRTTNLTIFDLIGEDNGNYTCVCRVDIKTDIGVTLTPPFSLEVIKRK